MTRQTFFANLLAFALTLVVSGCTVAGANGEWWIPMPKRQDHTLELDCAKDGIVRICLPLPVWSTT